MSTAVKIVLGIVAVLTITCIIVGIGGVALFGWAGTQVVNSISTGPEEAEEMAAEVAEFELPEGFQAQYGARMMGITFSSYTTANPNCHLFIAQAGPGSTLDVEDVQRMMDDAQPEQPSRYRGKMNVVREEDITVRGKPAKLVVSEGLNGENQAYRSMSVFFEGKGGPAMANISAPSADWEEEAFTRFITSIH